MEGSEGSVHKGRPAQPGGGGERTGTSTQAHESRM